MGPTPGPAAAAGDCRCCHCQAGLLMGLATSNAALCLCTSSLLARSAACSIYLPQSFLHAITRAYYKPAFNQIPPPSVGRLLWDYVYLRVRIRVTSPNGQKLYPLLKSAAQRLFSAIVLRGAIAIPHRIQVPIQFCFLRLQPSTPYGNMTHSDASADANILSPSPVTPVHQQLQRAPHFGMPRYVCIWDQEGILRSHHDPTP